MSRKLTSLLEFDGSETGRNRSFADLVPPGWASCEENLSRNIYAFLEFTLKQLASFISTSPFISTLSSKEMNTGKKDRNLIVEQRSS